MAIQKYILTIDDQTWSQTREILPDWNEPDGLVKNNSDWVIPWWKFWTITDHTEFEADWTMKAIWDASCYRDEYPNILVPASWWAAPDSVWATIWWVARQMYSFDWGNTEERLSWSIEIPHDYMYWTPIEVHVHYRPSTAWSGDVKRFFDWEWSPPQWAPQAQTDLSAVQTIDPNTQYYHRLVALWTLPDVWFELWGKIWFNIRRTPNDAQDTYWSDVLLEQVAIHIQIDTLWSRERYSK
jgi:hypothetical protein